MTVGGSAVEKSSAKGRAKFNRDSFELFGYRRGSDSPRFGVSLRQDSNEVLCGLKLPVKSVRSLAVVSCGAQVLYTIIATP